VAVESITCVQDFDRREAIETHGLAHDGEGGGNQTLAANQSPSGGNHKAWPIHRLWNGLHIYNTKFNMDMNCAFLLCLIWSRVKEEGVLVSGSEAQPVGGFWDDLYDSYDSSCVIDAMNIFEVWPVSRWGLG